MKRIITAILLIVSFQLNAQVLNNQCESQTPCNALPICGTATVSIAPSYSTTAPYNVNPGGAGTCADALGGTFTYTPNWVFFRFKCFTGGALNFAIIGNDLASDLDWAMWDITVSGCGSLSAGNLVECNAYPTAGAGGTGVQAAAAFGFEPTITLVAGNTYILGVARRNGGTVTTGFNINFAGTTANLTDNVAPALGSIVPFNACNPVTQLKVKMTKPIRCSQIQATDFNITGNPIFTATAGVPCPGCINVPATGANYSNVTDTVVIDFPVALAAGTYTLSLTGGVFPQPFLDICGNLANTVPTIVFTVPNPLTLTLGTSVNCGTGQYNDTAKATFGTTPYQFKAAGPGQTNTYGPGNVFTGLTGGNTYTITVRDANNCTASVVITHPPYIPMSLLTYKKNAPCNNQFMLDTLKVTQVNGGASPFTFSLASTPPGGAAGAILYAPGSWNNLLAGNYTITTTDAYGCTATATANIANPAVLTLPTPTSTNPTCFGDSTGTITCNATGGTAPVNNYVISPSYPNTVISGINNNIFSNLPGPGTYTIVVTDANGCTASNTRILSTPSQIVIYTGNSPASKINPTCTNPCGGSIIANATGGTGAKKFYKFPLVVPPNTYSDSVLVAGGSFLNLCAGTYTILAKDVQGCTSTATFVLALPSIPDLTVTAINPPPCNGGVGSIVTGVTGGTGPYTNLSYTFTPPTGGMTATASGVGGIVGTYNGVPVGVYTLTVTDVNNCKDSVLSVVMTQPTALVWNSTSTTNVLCNGANTGTASVNVTGGTGTITYTITPLGPQPNITGNFINLTAQCYTVTATDANLCTITSTFCITQPPALSVTIANIINVNCNPNCNGTAQATGAGGNPAYTYAISVPGVIDINTGAASALCAGTYTVTVTDANLCTATTTFTVSQPPVLSVAIANITNVSCNGLCDGTALANGAGGTPAYTYAISVPGVINANSGAITALCAGTYTVTVTDANLCTATTTFTVTQPPVLTASVSNITNVTCNALCNGTAQANASGGTPAYSYAINLPGVINVNTGAITALCAGIYTVTITDANLCTATTTFTVTEPPVLSVGVSNIINVTCNGLCNGSAQATGLGGTNPLSYSITAPGVINVNTGAATALCAGTYTVTVTDANLCTATSTFVVSQPAVLTANISNIVNVTCFGLCNGTAQASVAGGTPNYTYAITAPGVIDINTGAATALCAGTYTVTATDANLCTATTTFTVTQPLAVVANVSNITNVSCNGVCDGTAQAGAVGGTPAYTYAITTPGVIDINTGAITALCAGTYTVTVTDANNCTGTSTFTITEPNVLTITINTSTIPSCVPGCDGTATTITAGGTAAYAYSISGGAAINALGNATNLCAATVYTITVTDANNCTATTTIQLTAPNAPTVTVSNITNVTCNGLCNGTAQANGVGGLNPLSYTITAPGVIDVNTGAITGLCAGTYTVTVTDANLCTGTTSFTITEPTLLTVSMSNIIDATCNGLCNGSAQATGLGGTNPLSYTITAPGVIDVNTGAATALCAGTYTVTVTDGNLCTATTSFTINEPTAVVTTVTSSTNPTCIPGCDGEVEVTGNGGTGLIIFSISPIGPTQIVPGEFEGLCAGTNYVITGTDANGCTGTTNITLSTPNAPTASVSNITNVSCNGVCDGTAQAGAVGGTPGYTYAINAPGVIDINTGAITALCAGTYTVTVTDANNCTGTSTFTITEPNVLTVDINTTTPVSCVPGCDGTATTITAGGTAAYAYSISGGAAIDASGNATNLCAATVYTITVTDANNCTATTTIQLTAPNAPTVTVSNITNVTCNGLCNGTAQANGVGGLNPLSYTITAPGVIDVNTGAISGLCAGTYTVTVTDANLCTGTTSFTITEPTLLTVSMSNIIDATCNGLCNGSAQATGLGGTNPLSYTITAPGVIDVNTGAATALCAGTYTVTVTDGNLCTATTSFTINEPTAVVTTVTASTNPTCTPGCDGSVTVSGSGGTGLIVFSIIPNAGIIQNPAGTFTGLCAGTNYVITGTDANGCTGTTNISLSTPNAPTASVSNITNVSCNGLCDGTAQAGAVGGTPGYTFAITAPGVIDINTGAITALCAGSYTVTVTDANSCVGTTSFTVTEPNVLTVDINTTTPVSCVPGCDGTATTITAGGTAAYAYSISGGAIIDASGNATNLCAATVYTITVTDANNCTGTTTIQLTAPNAPTVTVSNITNVTCNGLCNGTAQANGVGGLNPLSYTITAPGVIDVNTGAITGLCAGTYTVTVTDANLCTGTTSFTITEPTLLTVSMSNIIDATCNGLCNGSAQATGLGGTNPLSYTITAPGVIDVNTGAATALCAGTYTVTVTDDNLCTATTSFTINEPTAVVTTVTASTNPTCTPGCDGSVTVSGSGGTGLIVFSIIPNAGIIQNPAGTFTGLCAGTNYVITGTDANGCTGTTNISLSTPNAPTASVSNITNVSCNGVCDGTAQAGAVGGTPGYTFAITAPGVIDINTGAITALCAGSYTVTVTDANSCVGTTSFTVTEPNVLTVDINTTTPVSCVPGCDGTATTITAGGTAAYAYSISGGATIDASGNATNLCAATVYTITVTDANNCTATTTIQLTAPNAPTVTVSNITNVTCNGLCNGTAQANGVGGLNPLSYTITAPGVIDVNTGAISGLCAGTYTVTVTDANLCTGTTSFTITEPALLTVSMSNIIDATCNGLCNGSAQATGLGGTNPLSYTITAPGVIDVNTGAATALCAGTYTVTVTDGNLCTATTSFIINEPTAVVTTVTASTNPTCTPGCDGSVTVSGSGGTGLIVFSIIPNAGIIQNPAGTFTGLCAGTNYVITGTDANGCTGTTNISLSTPNAPIVSVSNITNVSCNGVCDGTAQAGAVGGTPGYTYAINAPGVIDINTGAITALCAGSYTVTVTDANSCVGTTSFTVTEPNVLTVDINTTTPVSCVPGCDGTATTITAGGTAAYAYSISGGAAIDASGNATNLCAATVYTITVTDANNCTGTTTIQLTAPNAPTISINTTTPVTCVPGCDGTATTITAGGTPAYVYSISGGAAIDALGNATNLCSGITYTITVTDANNCTGTTTIQLTAPNAPTITINTTTPVTCVPGCDGTATTTTVGGTPAYVYSISGGATIDALGNATNLCAGTVYTITVTDANACTGTTTIQLIAPNAPTITINTTTPVTCVPGCDGTSTTITAGGTPAYVYSISGGATIDASGNATNLCAGTVYTITVTDANACTGTTTIQLTAPNAPTITINTTTPVTCVPGCDGTATTITAGGTPAYVYSISGGATIDALGNATNLCAGTVYTITVTDANACTGTTTIQLTAPNAPTITINTTTAPTCLPGCDGTATTITVGGTPAYVYSISGGATIDVLGNASNLCAGITYTITVTDANGCTGTTNISLSTPNAPTVSVSNITNVSCNGLCDGTAQAGAVGGTPGYVFAITAPGVIDINTGAITALCAGSYTVTVTDANSCVGTISFTVTEPNVLTVAINTTTPVSCVPGCDGTATTITAGGTAAYAYTISGGATIDALGNATNLCAGTVYTITVTDANNCTGTTTIQLTAPNAPTITINTTTPVSCVPGCDGTATTITVGGTPAYVYNISGGAAIDALGNATNLCSGITYTITVTDANNCTGTTTIQLTAPNAPTISINTTTPVSCVPGCDGTATTITAGGTPAYVYSISGGAAIDALGNATNLCSGITYTITVTDANNCTGTTTIQLTAPNAPTITINTTTPVSCVPGCDGTATTITAGGTPAYVYSISGGATIDALGNATNLCAGTVYTITVTDANACTGTTTIQLIAPNAPTITINTTTPVTCVPGCDGTATTTTAGGTPAYVYSISGGATIDALGNATNLCAGTVYTITVTDANACTGTTTIQLIAPNAPTITINTTTPVTCVPGCDGTATTITAGGTPAYVYSISGGATIDALGNATNLCAGTVYTITVTDANACTGTTTIQLTAPNAPTITINTTTAPTCLPGCDGTATTITVGGTPAYVYSISGGATIDVLGNASNLCAGITYTITVTDANGCTGTTNISLSTPNAPTVSVSNITNVSCNGLCDGTAQAGAVGGTPGYTFAITAPGVIDINTGAITALCAGSYTVTVTDANSCVGTISFTVTEPNVLTVAINTTTPVSCVPGCDGTATTITAGGTAAYAYSISGGAAIDALGNATNLCSGITYTITVTDANNCTGTTTIQLTAPNAPTITINTTTPVSCVPGCDGTATTITVGGTPVYAYSISGGAAIDALGNATNLCSGITYTITVTDANNCTGTTTIQLTAPNAPTISINTTTAPTCVPGCDGTATTITVGGTPAYVYSISGGAAIDALGNATNLCDGITYTITVTDINGCTGTTTIQLTAPNAPTITINTTTAPTCVPGCDGTATTITAGGTPAFVYSISGGAAIDALGNATNLCAGITYTITVTDANGCTGTTTIQLTAPNAPTISINTTTAPTCVPGCDGTATTITAGGTPAFVYSISGGAAIDALGNATNLCAGTVYTITVTDANGCTGTTTIQLTAPNAPTISINTTTAPTCVPGCDGTATTITAGGTPAYAYSISGGAAIDALGNATNLCAGTVYTITVTDANGCTGTTTIQLTTPASPTVSITSQTNVSCFGVCDGTLTVSGNGGVLPYSFTISPAGAQGPIGTFTGLCAGAYVVTITDANGCTGTVNATITEPGLLTIAVTAFTNVTVFGGNDGTITTLAAGGTPGYVYTINPNPVGAVQAPAGNFTNLIAGCYTITVTDANGCTATTSQCITEPPIGILTAVATNESCFGACDGTITSSITGGVAPFNFVLTPGNIGNATGFYTNLCAGTYTVTVTDANNNTTSTTATVGGPTQIVWNNAVATNVTCFGAGNGLINVAASGGVGLITYTITPLGPQTNINGVFSALTAQCYTVTATDINGCTSTTSLCVTEPGPLSLGAALVQDNSCFGGSNGTITINAIGGNPLPNYTYVLSPGAQTNTNGLFTGLGAGTYTVTVTDGSGCTASTVGIVVGQPASIVFNTVNLHEVYCYGQATGSIAVVASGGTGGILFSITPNATQFPLGFFKDLAAGNYVITATDANGCTVTTQATITQNPALTITSLSIVEPICAYDSTGVISVTATGGTAPIVYSLNNGIPQLTGTFTGLVIDMYKITLIDNLGCSKDTMIQLSGPTLVGATLQIEDTKCIDSKDGRVYVVGTGGRGGYKYYITPGLNINKTGNFYDLAAGTYTLRVVDTVGCEYMTVFTINPPANPLGNTMTKQDLGCYGKGNEGSATANVFGGQPPYVYQWSTSPVQTTAQAGTLYFGWYNVLIADANGCEYRDSVYIEEGPCCDVSFIPNAFSPNGDNNNDEFKVFSTAGIELIQLEVYDRWGQKLWSTSDYRRGWDGTVDGKEASVATYFYVFRYTCTRDGNTYIRKGDVTLIR